MADLGGFSDAEIDGASSLAVSTIAGASSNERFVRMVSNLVELRYEAGETAGRSVFLRSQTISGDIRERKTKALPFVCKGIDPVCSKVVISDAQLARAYSLDFEADDDIFEVLEQEGLGSHPALIVDWRNPAPSVVFWPKGVAAADDPIEIYMSDHQITPEEMKSILDDFYEARLCTPQRIIEGHSQKVWEEASKGWPASRPEERIQGVLVTYLRGRLKHDVLPEVPNKAGRLDVNIRAKAHKPNGDPVIEPLWTLELKALADMTSTGSSVGATVIENGLNKGVKQAHQYRKAEHTKFAALCCYDMRKNNIDDATTFAPIRKEANDNQIHLWRWFLFRSSNAWRDAQEA